MSDYILETKDLCKDFIGLRAIDSLNLAVKKGDVHGLIGPNGSGKSTFFKEKATPQYVEEVINGFFQRILRCSPDVPPILIDHPFDCGFFLIFIVKDTRLNRPNSRMDSSCLNSIGLFWSI